MNALISPRDFPAMFFHAQNEHENTYFTFFKYTNNAVYEHRRILKTKFSGH